MKQFIDISVPVDENLPIWPGSPGFEVAQLKKINAGESVNVSSIKIELHTGTHVDAPKHFIEGGKSIDDIPLKLLLGPVYVADFTAQKKITGKDIQNLNIPVNTERLIFHTDNSKLWSQERDNFKEDYVALTQEAAQKLVEIGIKVVGIDYLSIQLFEDGPETHQILLGENIIIIEGLNLSGVDEGEYQLICLPMKLTKTEAAPARVLLELPN